MNKVEQAHRRRRPPHFNINIQLTLILLYSKPTAAAAHIGARSPQRAAMAAERGKPSTNAPEKIKVNINIKLKFTYYIYIYIYYIQPSTNAPATETPWKMPRLTARSSFGGRRIQKA